MPHELHDSQFMTAVQKERVLKSWEQFLKYGCRREHFSEPLYNHLIQHCSFIAHYNRGGFYGTYFVEGEDTVRFLSQFDATKGARSVEYFHTWWLDGEYADINRAMVAIAAKYIPELVFACEKKQRDVDVARAKALLAKHGVKIDME